MARPTKFNRERAQRAVEAVRAGNYMVVAARLAGISESTLYEWLERGRAGRAPYAEFAREVERARAEAEARMLLVVQTAARLHWQAAAWFLERAFPDRWGRRPVQPPSLFADGPVEIQLRWPEDEGDVAAPHKTR
ncbi:MAG TPA: hypothetical protein VFA70_08085 [Dehalococcoidia bacterium]|nr:hypothetical protein [Dehalococcoidia bacterium]